MGLCSREDKKASKASLEVREITSRCRFLEFVGALVKCRTAEILSFPLVRRVNSSGYLLKKCVNYCPTLNK